MNDTTHWISGTQLRNVLLSDLRLTLKLIVLTYKSVEKQCTFPYFGSSLAFFNALTGNSIWVENNRMEDE